MNTRLLPESAGPLRKALWVAGLTCLVAQSVLLVTPVFGWSLSSYSLLRRLPLSVQVLVVCICAGISAALLTELLRMCSRGRWGGRRHFRVAILLWIVCAAIQGAMLLVG